jgi:phthiocerol/phenolphthiocerol synthesis type-I polyketide synthase E
MTRDRSLDIAVTGVSGRFPGCADIDQFWTALTAGRVLTTRLARHELIQAGVPENLVDDPDYVPVRGYLADADRFDNTLFRVSPRDAELMDPQHRLMLETAWAALEDAGQFNDVPTTAVYASGSGSGYLRTMLTAGPMDPQTLDQALHGTEPDFIASLISYKLALTGPAVGVQTACSSSLVGLHMAIQALLNGDCDQAIVVAAGIDFPQAGHLAMPGGIQSAAGDCRPFDQNADGVVAGSGAAAVVLRRLADAIEDEPYGVILGTAINNDGAAKAGYYAPSVVGQEAVIRAALNAADVDADSIGFLETHGTGTRVGDPIEWSAASAALGGLGAQPGQVAIGALKANVGHIDSASGLASLIKALLVVKEGVIPPVAGFTGLNPLLETDGSPLYVPTEVQPWTGPQPRRAGISSFGIGGTNAHVIIEQAPKPATPRHNTGPELVLLSAADPDALTRAANRLGDHLRDKDPDLTDVSYTLVAGRATLSERLAVSGRTSAEVAERLAKGDVVRGRRPADGPAPAVFVFPGQGSQYPGMALPFAALPGFDAALDRCLGAFARSASGIDPALASKLRCALLDPQFPAAKLATTELAQPALFAVEYAAATALTELGVTPVALVGHSLGEITAACMAGVLSLSDAARFVAARGQAMQACPPGAMLALGCDEATACEFIAESGAELELASINAPASCVVAGTGEAVEAFRDWLADRVFSKVLRTSHAFHSELIEPAIPILARALSTVDLDSPGIPFASNATGELIPAGALVQPDIFVDQARLPVRFAEAMAAVGTRFPDAVVVEVGPGRALSSMAEDAVPLSPARTAHPDQELLTALGTLWTLGQPIDPAALCGDGRRIHLPTYPFAGPKWMAPEAVALVPPPDLAPAPQATEPVLEEAPDASALVANLWAELLGHADLSADSDFFQLGGDSLLITQLARKVHQELGVRVPLRDMLAGRTLGKQTTIVLDLLVAR